MPTEPTDAAFATSGVKINDDRFDWGQPGITKREYFAAQALMGLLADHNNGNTTHINSASSVASYAKCAVQCADALIAELNKESR